MPTVLDSWSQGRLLTQNSRTTINQCCPLVSDFALKQITVDTLVHQAVLSTVLNQCRSLVLTTKSDFHCGSGSLQSRCPTQSHQKTHPRHRQWAEQLAEAAISLAEQQVRQGHDLEVQLHAEIVVVCCEAAAAFLSHQHSVYKTYTHSR